LLIGLSQAAEREDWAEHNLRSTAYETINTLIDDHPEECRPIVLQCSTMIMMRLDQSFHMQIVSNDDRENQDMLQALLVSTLHMILRRCDAAEVGEFAGACGC
jgi:hypothetical protein